MDYRGSDRRSVEADRYICKPVSNRELEREKTKPNSLLKTINKQKKCNNLKLCSKQVCQYPTHISFSRKGAF